MSKANNPLRKSVKATQNKLPPPSKASLQAKAPAGRAAQAAFQGAKVAQQKVATGKVAFSAAKTAQQKVAQGKIAFEAAKTAQQRVARGKQRFEVVKARQQRQARKR